MKTIFAAALLSLAIAADDKCWTADELVALNEGSHLCS